MAEEPQQEELMEKDNNKKAEKHTDVKQEDFPKSSRVTNWWKMRDQNQPENLLRNSSLILLIFLEVEATLSR